MVPDEPSFRLLSASVYGISCFLTARIGTAVGFVTCGLVASVNVDDFLPSAPARIASVGQFSQRNVIRVTMDTETLDI